MIVDAFLYNDEVELLSLRIRYLCPLVREFWVLKSRVNFLGEMTAPIPRDLFKLEKKLRVKIKVLEYDPALDPIYRFKKVFLKNRLKWHVQNCQRNQLKLEISKSSLQEIFILSDVDEIPKLSAIQDYISSDRLSGYRLKVFSQDFFYYSLKWMRENKWRGSVIGAKCHFAAHRTSEIRSLRNELPFLPGAGGWHLSYFGGNLRVGEKRRLIYEQSFEKNKVKPLPTPQDAQKYGLDPWGRQHNLGYTETGALESAEELLGVLTPEEKKWYGV